MNHSAFDLEVTVHEGIWTAQCDALGLATEADSYPDLVTRSLEIVPELAELNAVGIPPSSCDCASCMTPWRVTPHDGVVPLSGNIIVELLRAAGCRFVRQGKGSHEIWHSPINGKRFSVSFTIATHRQRNPETGGPESPASMSYLPAQILHAC